LRDELQKYLDKNYQNSRIESPQSIFGEVHIRFELGGDKPFEIIRNGIEIEWWNDRRKMTKADKINYENHTLSRVLQATKRATTIFNETFDNLETEIWFIIYEYKNGLFNQPNDFLLHQISETIKVTFYDNLEQVETQMLTEQENGDFTCDKTEARIIIGKLKVKDIKTEIILNGIANNEMGLEPSISQNVYFLDPTTNNGFHMYDDRGCYVWSDKAEKINSIYKTRNNWIAEYHRNEIDEYFKHL
jgi:hypothetical protein